MTGTGRSRSVSIVDVAQAAGVSPSTVSRALHAHPRISPITTARICDLARQMGYTPSQPARSLVTRQTSTIGMCISHVSDPFLGAVVEGVEDEARRHGYSVFLSSAYRDAEREQQVLNSLYERRVDGVVVSGSQLDTRYVELRRRYPLPIVLINCPQYPLSVTTDNRTGGQQAVEHLVALGHRHIAYVGNPQSCLSNRDRREGYLSVLRGHDLPQDERWLVEGNGDLEGGAEAAGLLFALPHPPTAVFCFNDLTAIGMLHALSCAGRRVPGDCSIVGFDDLELAAYTCPPLTTIHQPRHELGRRAMRMVLDLIQGRDDAQAETLPARLVVRQTTGPAPVPAGKARR